MNCPLCEMAAQYIGGVSMRGGTFLYHEPKHTEVIPKQPPTCELTQLLLPFPMWSVIKLGNVIQIRWARHSDGRWFGANIRVWHDSKFAPWTSIASQLRKELHE